MKNEPTPPRVWSALVVQHTLTALVFAGTVETWHYANGTQPGGLPEVDWLALWWFLTCKTWLVLTPLLVGAGVCLWRGWLTLAKRLYIASSVCVFLWLALDIGTQRLFGTHLSHYLPYVIDLFGANDTGQAARFGGDLTPIFRVAAGLITGVAGLVFLGWKTSTWVAGEMARHFPSLTGRRGLLLCVAVAFVQFVSVVPIQLTFGHGSSQLRRLHSYLPIDIKFTRAWAVEMRQWAVIKDFPITVRIVSLRPNPRGTDAGKEEITLHNFGTVKQDLEGWYLVDRRGNRLPLRGTLSIHESRLIRLAQDSPITLPNKSGRIGLFDSTGKRRHEVRYGKNEAFGGTVINFRDEDDFDAFSVRVNKRLAPAYREILPQLTRRHDTDPGARIKRRAQLPDVLVIAVESLAHSAMAPEVMARLDRWAKQGLRLNRHYSNSNISHFGIYSLLYGRLPLFYDRDLDHGIRPQLCETFAEAGYRTVYMASGQFTGWRRMEEFLHVPNFDEIVAPGIPENWNGSDHAGWIKNDRWLFGEVRRRLSIQGDQPQMLFVFPVSTHYPYEFPTDFNIRRPSGVEINHSNWMKLDQQQLKNRYHNSVLFLEDEIIKTLDSLDPNQTIVVLTGDHGESLGEDGVLSHGSRPSEIQLRVPFAMVGPGIPARVIETATSHLDMLPTLLHAVNEQAVPLRGHGRDLLELASPTDQVLLTPRQFNEPHDLLLIRGDQRILFKTHLSKPKIQTYGLVDERGAMALEAAVPPGPEQADVWVDTLIDHLQPM